MKIKQIYHYQKDDTDFSGDYSDIEVFIDGELEYTFMDGYHDDGPEMMDGFRMALRFLNVDYKLLTERVADRDW